MRTANPWQRLTLFAVLLATLGGIGVALGQGANSIDLDAIAARGRTQQGNAEDLVAGALARAGTAREEAVDVAAAGEAALRRGPEGAGASASISATGAAGPVDLDAMVAGARDTLTSPRSGPMLVAFASLSMPEASLRRLIGDVTAAGGVVVFRGFPAGNPARFALAMQKLVARDQAASVLIDPRLFRAFRVQSVPTWIATTSDYVPCDSLTCVSTVPPYDRIAGNITTRYALDAIADGGGAGAPVARMGLAHLGAPR
ncbi:type-F conjugative transfer system pilin assembly protein TrbC [Novosphingobium olei]|uniref:type-F conjugative transfer system pilin assembly protein TrbC n=1 Tax=Novosphingobium olei TaxID=2728851 RepID=UPI0030B8FED7